VHLGLIGLLAAERSARRLHLAQQRIDLQLKSRQSLLGRVGSPSLWKHDEKKKAIVSRRAC
jgi:hypothetical protein